MPNAIIEAESRVLPAGRSKDLPAVVGKSKAEVVASIANVTINKTGDVAIEVIRNPMLSVVLAAALIEGLQRVQLGTGRYGWIDDPRAPVSQWGEIKTPLISQAMASTLEGVVITKAALDAFGGLGGIAGLLGKLIG